MGPAGVQCGGAGEQGAVLDTWAVPAGRATPQENPPGCVTHRLGDIRRQSHAAGPQPSWRCLKVPDGSSLV